MSTRRGPKVEPHENPRIETPATIKIENEYFAIKTDNPVTLPKEEGLKYGEDYVENPDVKRTLQESLTEPVVSSGATGEKRVFKIPVGDIPEEEIEEYIKKVVQKFKPIEVKTKKAIGDLNQTELRVYQKTGILPDL